MINCVDDQVYFVNDDSLQVDFETKLAARFKVDIMGWAHWYLQARLTQHANYSITLDQSRYMALIATRSS